MSIPSPTPAGSGPPVGERLQELARLLRGAGHLGPQVQRDLADLLEELAGELESAAPSPHAEHLAESAAHVAHELHQERGVGRVGAAVQRLKEAAARAEAKAPVATGLARRLVDVLADIGI
jgi:hypothetical protein